MAYESENLFLNQREATAGWEKQFRNKSPSPPVADIKWSRSVAFRRVHATVIWWARGESLAWNQTDPTLQLAPSLPKLTLRFSPTEEVRARRRTCPTVSTANPLCYFETGGAGETEREIYLPRIVQVFPNESKYISRTQAFSPVMMSFSISVSFS